MSSVDVTVILIAIPPVISPMSRSKITPQTGQRTFMVNSERNILPCWHAGQISNSPWSKIRSDRIIIPREELASISVRNVIIVNRKSQIVNSLRQRQNLRSLLGDHQRMLELSRK